MPHHPVSPPGAAPPPGNRPSAPARRLASDSALLVAGSAATAALGLAFWVAATALFPVEEVGRASTAVATGTVLASIANLSLGPLLERFLPAAGGLRGRGLALALGVSAVAAAVLGGAYAAWMPEGALFASAGQRAAFAGAVVVLAAFALLDSALIGLRRARWVVAKNLGHAAAKLLAVLALAWPGGADPHGAGVLAGGWVLTAAIAVAAVELALWLTRARWGARDRPPALPPPRELARFGAASLGWMLAQALPGIAIPTIVILGAGPEGAAYYNIAWTIVTASLVATSMVTGPFVAAASRPGADQRALARSLARVLIAVSVLRGLGVGVLGPLALHLYGSEYAAHGAPLLVLMGIAHALSGPALYYGALARVARRIAYPMLVQLLASALVIALVAAWIAPAGILAVGWAFLVHDLAVLAAATPPLLALRRRLRTRGSL